MTQLHTTTGSFAIQRRTMAGSIVEKNEQSDKMGKPSYPLCRGGGGGGEKPSPRTLTVVAANPNR